MRFALGRYLAEIFTAPLRRLPAALLPQRNSRGDREKIIGQVNGGFQEFIGSLRAALGQDHCGKYQARFVYYVSQCFQIVLFVGHEQTVAPQRSDCKRLLFSINAALGHYRRFRYET
jgi:hypothetical protein